MVRIRPTEWGRLKRWWISDPLNLNNLWKKKKDKLYENGLNKCEPDWTRYANITKNVGMVFREFNDTVLFH